MSEKQLQLLVQHCVSSNKNMHNPAITAQDITWPDSSCHFTLFSQNTYFNNCFYTSVNQNLDEANHILQINKTNSTVQTTYITPHILQTSTILQATIPVTTMLPHASWRKSINNQLSFFCLKYLVSCLFIVHGYLYA